MYEEEELQVEENVALSRSFMSSICLCLRGT
jgi:hypothetical protein